MLKQNLVYINLINISSYLKLNLIKFLKYIKLLIMKLMFKKLIYKK